MTERERKALNTRGNRVTYLGHSTFSLTTSTGQVALIDPWVTTNPSCPDHLKQLPRLDVIFLTHGHGDHLGDLLALAKQHRPQIVAIFEACAWIESKGFGEETRPMSKGGRQKVGEFEVTMTHAFHSSAIDDNGVRVYAGEPAGIVIRMPGGFTIYHAGDTALFGDMRLIGELYRPDLACLPIGDLYTMGPRRGLCDPPASGEARRSHALRYVSVSNWHSGSLAARSARHCRHANPRTEARREPRLILAENTNCASAVPTCCS